jgi:hypothetical protein
MNVTHERVNVLQGDLILVYYVVGRLHLCIRGNTACYQPGEGLT